MRRKACRTANESAGRVAAGQQSIDAMCASNPDHSPAGIHSRPSFWQELVDDGNYGIKIEEPAYDDLKLHDAGLSNHTAEAIECSFGIALFRLCIDLADNQTRQGYLYEAKQLLF